MERASGNRRTRFVCISDTHNTQPKLPAGDVLIHAGDLTNQGSLSELQRTVAWLERAPFKCKIVIAGNHDITLDSKFYAQYSSYFHNQVEQNSQECIDLLTHSSAITYLNHQARTIYLPTEDDGHQVRFKVFGSPYSPRRGVWAFGYTADSTDADALWAQIPLDSDVVVTHTPPKNHCDESIARGSAGCESLRRALWRVRPRLAVCGHIHEGRGAETVRWDLQSRSVAFKESELAHRWEDHTAGTKRQFCVDLSARTRNPLRNDGAAGEFGRPMSDDVGGCDAGGKASSGATLDTQVPDADPPARQAPFPDADKAETPVLSGLGGERADHLAARGLGGLQSGGPCDRESLLGREGRAETCVVNAAIMALSWPHRGGKRLNNAIVVDMDLPVIVVDSGDE